MSDGITEERRIPNYDKVDRLRRRLDRVRLILYAEMSVEEFNWVEDVLREFSNGIEPDHPGETLINMGKVKDEDWDRAQEPEWFIKHVLPEEGYMSAKDDPEEEP